MPKVRKVPMRMCVGCREMKPKKELMRVVKSPEGQIDFDPVGKKPGRGAYLCPDEQCLKRARKHKTLSRALETEIGDDIYETLEMRLCQICKEP